MSAPEPRRRLDEFDPVTPSETDYIVGYRPGEKGIRFPIAALATIFPPIPLSLDSLSEEDADTRYLKLASAEQLYLRKTAAITSYPTKIQIAETYVTKAEAADRYAPHGELILTTESGRRFLLVAKDNFNTIGDPDVRLELKPIV